MPSSNGSNYKSNSNNDTLEQGGRVPPQAVEVEKSVLGSMLIEHEAATIALQMLQIEDFYSRHIATSTRSFRIFTSATTRWTC
jgi:replicative DNA helicase